MSLWADFLTNDGKIIDKWSQYFPVYEDDSRYERVRRYRNQRYQTLTPVLRSIFAPRHRGLPVAEELAARLLRLPLFHDLTESEQQRIVECISQFLRRAASPASASVELAFAR